MKEQWDEPQIIFTHQIQKSIFKTPLSIGVTKFWVICLVVNTNFSSLCKMTHRLITDVIKKTFSLLLCRCFFSHYVVCWFWQKSVTACFLLVSWKLNCLRNAFRGYIKPKIVNTCYLIASISKYDKKKYESTVTQTRILLSTLPSCDVEYKSMWRHRDIEFIILWRFARKCSFLLAL